ncbi:MAG: shikimate kinase [Endomicrobia bacterium]|nr:shikimate kinase [Endomicrobiia bacterium]
MVNIVITGFMCSGKTSVGLKLKDLLKYDYVDTDEIIEKVLGLKISDIFAKFGETYFREIESKVVREVSSKDKTVISTGGGVVLRTENIENLRKNGIIVNLTASPFVILERLKKQPGIRPLLNKPDPLAEIIKFLNEREKYYRNCDFRVNTDKLSVDEVANVIVGKLKEKNLVA